MARPINVSDQQNTWGAIKGLEPQRADLFYVDFSNALSGLRKVSGLDLAGIKRPYVRSITLPSIRTKSESIRRYSTGYNMPSWDEALEAVKVVFLLDTKDEQISDVVAFLDAWLAVTRAGRGTRSFGLTQSTGCLSLNSNYSIDFRFDFTLNLLRGANTADIDVAALASTNTDNSNASSFLNNHCLYTYKNGWLGEYKMSDYSHDENKLITVDSTFYVDDVLPGSSVNTGLFGSADVLVA